MPAEKVNSGKTGKLWSRKAGYWMILVLILFLAFVFFSWMKPKVVDFGAKMLNRMVIHGDSVTVDNIYMRDFFGTPTFYFKDIKAWGKNSEPSSPEVIRVKTGILVLDIWSTASEFLAAFNLSEWELNYGELNIDLHLVQLDSVQLNFQNKLETQRNYVIFRPATRILRGKDKRPKQIDIQNFNINACTFNYLRVEYDSVEKVYKERDYQVKVDTVTSEMVITREKIIIGVDSLTGITRSLDFDSLSIIVKTDFSVSGELAIHKMERQKRAKGGFGSELHLDSIMLYTANTKLLLEGYYLTENQKDKYALHLMNMADNFSSMETILKLLPESNADLIRSYNVKGDLSLNAALTKTTFEQRDPHIEVLFRSEDVSFTPKVSLLKNEQSISDLSLAGRYSNGSENNIKTSFIEFDSISANIGSPLEFQSALKLENIYDPEKIYVEGYLNVDSTSFPHFLSVIDSIPHQKSAGDLSLNLSLSGLLKHLNLASIDEIQYDGNIDLYDLQLHTRLKGFPLRLDNLTGSFDLDNSNIVIKEKKPLSGNVNHIQLIVNGSIHDIAQYIVRQKANLDPVLSADLKLTVEDIHIENLIDSLKNWISKKKQVGRRKIKKDGLDIYYDLEKITKEVNVDLKFLGKRIDCSGIIGDNIPEKLTFENVSGDLHIGDNLLYVNDFLMTNQHDTVRLELFWDGRQKDQIAFESSLNISTNDLHRLARNFNMDIQLGKIDTANLRASTILKFSGVIENNEKGDLVRLALRMENGSIKSELDKFNLDNISLYTEINQDHLSSMRSTPIFIDSINMRIDRNPLDGKLMIQDWKSKWIDLTLRAEDFPLSTLHKYVFLLAEPGTDWDYSIRNFVNTRGDMNFQTHLSGNMDTVDIIKSLLYVSQDGFINFSDLGFDIIRKEKSPLNFESINGVIEFDPNGLSLEHIRGEFGNSDFEVTGYGRDILPFFFDNQPLKLDFSLSSDTIDLKTLIGDRPEIPEEEKKSLLYDSLKISGLNLGEKIHSVLRRADMEGIVKVKNTFYSEENSYLDLQDFLLKFIAEDKRVSADTFYMDYADGFAGGKAFFDLESMDYVYLDGDFYLENIETGNLASLFTASLLNGDDLEFRGLLSADIHVEDTVGFSENWHFGESTNGYIANLNLLESQVKGLDRVNALKWDSISFAGKFGLWAFLGLNRERLYGTPWQFLMVEDTIYIKDGQIEFNNLEIQSNKVYMNASGVYGLKGEGTEIKTKILRASREEREGGRHKYSKSVHRDYRRSALRPKVFFDRYSDAERKELAEILGLPLEEVEYGELKTRWNIGYTLATLPRQLIFIFSKNNHKLEE